MFNFKKKYGQNFLTDKNLLNAIVSDAEIEKDDFVIEIGAGAGALTEVISSRAKKVVAFEIDSELEGTLNSLNLKNVTFRFEDFMKVDLKEFKEPFKVVANLPYYITTPIIFKLLEETDKLISLTVMVQKEVAERMVADVSSDYGVLSVMLAFYGQAKITRIVKRNMFYPEPNVDSAVVTLKIEKKYDVDKLTFYRFVKTAFSMRRKTLFNNLSTIYSKDLLKQTFSEDFLKRRAETLTIDEFVEAYKKILGRTPTSLNADTKN